MRLFLLTAVLALAALAAAQPQQSNNGGGFFNNLRNFLRPRRQNRFPPPPPPPRNNNFGPPRNNFGPPRNNFRVNNGNRFNPPPPQQQQQQNFAPNNGGFNPAPAPPQSQPQTVTLTTSNSRPSFTSSSSSNSGSFRNTASAAGGFSSSNSNSNAGGNSNKNNNFRKCDFTPSKAACPKAAPNHNYNGQDYLLTFNMDCGSCACRNFTGSEADDYCKSMGARAVSLDSQAKWQHFKSVSIQFAERYFWTGGRMNYPDQTYTWPSGVTKRVQNSGDPWSTTGGWSKPQPDNRNQLRDNCEPELCIGVLNNFYADGVVWHDVACHHKKPTICEWPRGVRR